MTSDAHAEPPAKSPDAPIEGPLAIQVSGRAPDGGYLLSVLAKRSYRWIEGTWLVDEEQTPLTVEPLPDPDHPELMLCDTDLHPFKCRTDLIIKGSAQGRGRTMFQVMVAVGNRACFIDVTGDRQLERSPQGRLRFTPPQPIESVPLSFAHAYGGLDVAAEQKYGNPYLELHEEFRGDGIDLNAASPFRYPRNPAGRGYLVEWNDDQDPPLALPNLEDPEDRLTAERIVAGDIDAWSTMPVPVATEWFDYGYFPRNALFGFVPMFDPELPLPREIALGGLPPELWNPDFVATPASLFAGVNGAPLPLQFPLLSGEARIELREIHPTDESWVFRLPDDRPVLRTDGRGGKLKETDPVIHTVLLEPDQDRMTVLWRGSAPALRPYLPEELERMPFEAIWPGSASSVAEASG